MKSKRENYRVAPRRRLLTLTMVSPEGPVRGELMDLSVKGCGAAFLTSELSALEPDATVTLEFSALLLVEPLRAEAVVRRVSERDGTLRVGFEFTWPEAVKNDVPFVLLREFNRRESPRVVLDDIVEVVVQSLGIEGSALLLDISTGGLALRVTSEVARRLSAEDRVEVRFHLKERDEEFRLTGKLNDLRLVDDYVVCSMQFDTAESDGLRDQLGALGEIISQRRRDVPPVPEG